jgi:hypothetical protein
VRVGGEMRQMYVVILTRDNRQRRVARRRNFRGCKESINQGKRGLLGGGPKEGSWSWPMPVEEGIPWRTEETLRCMRECGLYNDSKGVRESDSPLDLVHS